MRTFKNWKSELKKKGAMALTAFLLCGSAGTAFADDSIMLNETTSDGIGVKNVTGYQTDLVEEYAANITWGDMLFVYDRGTYDPEKGTLVGSFKDIGIYKNRVEAGGDFNKAGYWYGFDGRNNAVQIENLSTNKVKLTATPKVEEGENLSDVKFSLYIQSSDNDTWDIVKEENLTEEIKHGAANNDVVSGVSNKFYMGETGKPISRTFEACTLDEHGENPSTDKDFIYLNITGKPGNGFMNETTYNAADEGSRSGEKLGTITLSFNKENGTALTVKNSTGSDEDSGSAMS